MASEISFHLPFQTPAHPRPLQAGQSILSMGSCFADAFGRQMERLGMPVSINPFGITFDAFSIERQLGYLSGGALPQDVFEHLNLWRHFDCHGSLSHPDRSAFEETLDRQLTIGRQAFSEARMLILTFGTSFFFQKDQREVANCHKLPAQNFTRKLAEPKELYERISQRVLEFIEQDEDREVLLSVSPIRHIRDGLAENNRSKARLIELSHSLCEMHERIRYFPSYEWLIDVWRDHRFYAEDMLHPSLQSIEAIFAEFVENHCSEELKICIADARAYLKLTEHRILSPRSEEAIQLQQKTAERKQELLNKHPFLRI
ncbi:MAG: hypothetical protein EBT52_08185 [Flavobacteriia bacterium]|nr:hypothetical protein [Flavobacteriia bacterium]